MHHDDDTPLSAEELALAKKGEELIASAVAEVQAPQSLREAIEHDRERLQAQPRPSFWRRHRPALAATLTACAVLAVAVVALQSGSNDEAPSLAAVESAARLGSTAPAPALKGGDPPVLAARVGAISFPDWKKSFGWEAVGRRDDTVSGREVVTVYYRNPEKGTELGYAVVDGEPLSGNLPGRRVNHKGKAYNVTPAGSRTVVTWVQQGQTCMIVASAKVPEAKLIELAASRNT